MGLHFDLGNYQLSNSISKSKHIHNHKDEFRNQERGIFILEVKIKTRTQIPNCIRLDPWIDTRI